MKRLFAASLAAALALTLSSTDTSAQWVFLGAATTLPLGDYGAFAKTGYLASGGVMFPVGEGRVSVGAGGFFGTNSHDTDGDKTNLYGANAIGGVALADPEASARPFAYGGLGFMTRSRKSESFPAFDRSESNVAATGGAGLAFAAGESLSITVSASYTTGFGDNSGTDFVSLGAAAQISLGAS